MIKQQHGSEPADPASLRSAVNVQAASSVVSAPGRAHDVALRLRAPDETAAAGVVRLHPGIGRLC